MIESDETPSTETGMDITEAFRPEDLSKTDFFDFVTTPDLIVSSRGGDGGVVNIGSDGVDIGGAGALPSISIDNPPIGGDNDCDLNGVDHQPLQGFDQFWGVEKDTNRLETTIFEDLNRYCWNQQEQSQQSGSLNQIGNTDGQIYTLTVLNGSEPWLRKNPQPLVTDAATTLDLDSFLGTFPGYIKSEFVYEDGFSNSNNNNNNSNNQNATNGTNSKQTMDNIGTGVTTNTNNNANLNRLKINNLNSLNNSLSINASTNLLYANNNNNNNVNLNSSNDNNNLSQTNATTLANEHQSGQMDDLKINQQPLGNSFHCINNDTSCKSNSNNSNKKIENMNDKNNNSGTCNVIDDIKSEKYKPVTWDISDHSLMDTDVSSPDSLLRSALQGKGYSTTTTMIKAMGHHQQQHSSHNILLGSIAKDTSPNDMELRHVLFVNEYPSNSLPTLFESDEHGQHNGITNFSTNSNSNSSLIHIQNEAQNQSHAQVVSDEMFLTLDSTFTDDFEKLKRMASEFCEPNNNNSNATINHNSNSSNQLTDCGTFKISDSLLNDDGNSFNGTDINISLHALNGSAVSSNHSMLTMTSATNLCNISSSSSSSINVKETSKQSSGSSGAVITQQKKKYKRSLNNNNIASSHNNNILNSAEATNNNNTTIKNLNNTSAAIQNGSHNMAGVTPQCGSATSSSHQQQQRKERSLHYCSICSKGFKDKYSVNVHIRTHTGEKPFACSLCGKSFRQKAHLAKHYQTHLAQKNAGANVNGNNVVSAGGGLVSMKGSRKMQLSQKLNSIPATDAQQQQQQLQQQQQPQQAAAVQQAHHLTNVTAIR